MIRVWPLLILLLVCALHLSVILAIQQLLSDMRKISHPIPITLITLAKAVKPKPVSVISSPVTADTVSQLITVEKTSPALSHTTPIVPKIKAVKKTFIPMKIVKVQRVKAKQKPIAQVKIVVAETPVEPTVIETVAVETVKPVPVEKATPATPPVVPVVIPEVKITETPAVDPEITKPVVETKPPVAVQPPIVKEVSKPVIKPIAKSVETEIEKPKQITTEAKPQLSLDDLTSQIAEASEKVVNQEVAAMENKVETAKSGKSHRYLKEQYIHGWKQKVHRLSALNHPPAVEKKGFTGLISLEVKINADGSIRSMRFKKSSGDTEIDQELKDIVRMGEPFSAFPSALSEELDVLAVTFTWNFVDGVETR